MTVRSLDERTYKVVVIDDNVDVRRLLSLRLDFEHQLEWIGEAGDGTTGLEVVWERRPDAVILNVELPALNGLQVLRSLRQTGFDGVVVVYTASAAATTAAVAGGADGAFLKTGSVTDVLDCIVAACLNR
jgi:DNA-binding NarL/FixJ family response regulator